MRPVSERVFRYVRHGRVHAWQGAGWQVISGPAELKPPPGLEGPSDAVLVVAASRIYLEAHWLSDVVGGFAIGLAYLLLALQFLTADTLPRRPRHGA